MPNAEKELRIKITTQADTPKVREYSRSVDDLTKQTHAATAATGKLTAGKHQLRQAARGLGLQFPLLGRVMSTVLNPITLSVAGIVAAFKVWQGRVEGLSKTLGQVELPDAVLKSGERINAAADAWERYHKAVQSAREELDSVEASHARAMKALEQSKDIVAMFSGGELPPEAERALGRSTAAEQHRTAANLLIRGKGRAAHAARLTQELNAKIAGMDPDAVRSLIAANEGQASTAEGEASDRRARLKFIDTAQKQGRWNLFVAYEFYRRYGYGGTYEDARNIERNALAGAEARETAARQRAKVLREGGFGAAAMRSQIDELTSGAAADMAAASRGFAGARETELDSQLAYGMSRIQRGMPLISSQSGGGITVTPEIVALLRENRQLAMAILEAERKYNTFLQQQLGRLNSRPE